MSAIPDSPRAIKTYRSAQSLERFLGHPFDRANSFSFQQLMAFDEKEAFPHALMKRLNDWGLNQYYVPADLNGRLQGFEELTLLALVLANRDMSLAIAHNITFLGCITVWLAPHTTLRASVARQVLSGASVAFGLTEEAHGSDISRSDTCLSEQHDVLTLRGEKWAINMASHCEGMTVFCREQRAGEDLYSLVYFDKRTAPHASYRHLPRIRTLGLRAAHISGIHFDRAALDPACRIGAPGDGLALALKGLAISRSAITGIAIGTADRALRVAIRLLTARKLYGGSASDIPHVRQALTDAFVDLLVCQVLTFSAVRGIHIIPEQLSLHAAIVKYQVPALTEQIFDRLMFVMGSRAYFREEHDCGIFQKFFRDQRVMNIFDGSGAVNLDNLARQLPLLVRRRQRADAGLAHQLCELFSFGAALPDADLSRIALHANGHDSCMAGVPLLRQQISAATAIPAGLRALLLDYAAQISLRVDTLAADVEAIGSQALFSRSAPAFALAREYCRLHAASACTHAWIVNRGRGEPFFDRADWLVLALSRLLGTPPASPSCHEEAYDFLTMLYRQNRLFSFFPLVLSDDKS